MPRAARPVSYTHLDVYKRQMLACAKAMDICGLPRKNIVAVTMPCFGTTDRTKNNAITIAEQLGAELRVIPIGESVKKHFETIGHDFNDHSVVFENAQARERTMVLLDIANKVNGLDVGTKDLSEQADGWCTYNGDQISNYDINAGLTKSMVRAVVKYISETTEDEVLAAAPVSYTHLCAPYRRRSAHACARRRG